MRDAFLTCAELAIAKKHVGRPAFEMPHGPVTGIVDSAVPTSGGPALTIFIQSLDNLASCCRLRHQNNGMCSVNVGICAMISRTMILNVQYRVRLSIPNCQEHCQ